MNAKYDGHINENQSPNRVIGLDLLRIALALLIYMFHSWMHFECHYSYLTSFVSVGAIAMTGFFMLSGYSMRLVYGKTNLIDKNNLKIFYLKRVVGIIPLYYALSLMYVIFLGTETLRENLLLFPIEALCLQSTFSSLFSVTHNGGTWFISCIMLAYLIYPFMQTIFRHLNNKIKIIILFLLVFIDIWAAIISIKFDTAWIYENPFYRIIEFTCGLIVADINISYDGKIMTILRSWGILLLTAASLVVAISVLRYYAGITNYMLLNVIALPCFLLMLFPLGYLSIPILEKSRIISYLSKISYAFFLSQFFVWKIGRWMVNLIGYDYNWIRVFLSLSCCVIISILMYEFIQKPCIKFAKRKAII